MTDPKILLASLAAAYLYVVTPGPAFLALFTLAASRGRAAGAWFICGHLVGDVTWGALAVAAIVGANRIGPTLFELLGFVCGLYLLYLGARAVMTKKDAPPRTIGAKRPLATGMAFGLTNPKSYPVALAMFSAIVAPYIGALKMADAPQMFVAAFVGFLLADVTLIFAAGLPAVRRFFLTHGVVVTRLVGVIFILFGAKSIADAAGGAMTAHGLRARPTRGTPPNKSKENQRNPRKKAWISLDSFGQIGPFQWVTANPRKKFLSVCFRRRPTDYRPPGRIPTLVETSTDSVFRKEIAVGTCEQNRSRGSRYSQRRCA